mmetsp:Transcript_12267/g.28649  ORF Transcript_12267/g.28649 Transcript_12267/m.28649 type:complete len:355 (-) Transcript_12267:76-1140(-)
MATGGTGTELPANTPLPGKVKAWMEDKGFGFVTPDNGGPDIFVHRNQLTDGQSLVAGAAVTIECRYNTTRGKYEATTCSGAVAAGAVPAAAAAALSALTGVALPGAVALPAASRGPADNLFVAGLPEEMDEEGIRQLFSQYGTVIQCKVLPDTPGKPDRAALVRMADESQARWMVDNLNGNIATGLTKPLTVKIAGDRGNNQSDSYGKAATAGVDNRFLPYGAVGGLGLGLPGVMDINQQLQMLQSLQGLAALGQAGALGVPQAGLLGALPPAGGVAQPGVTLPSATPAYDPAAVAAAAAGVAAQPAAAVPATAPASVPSAGAWLEAKDPTSGRSYYYHSVTRETRWERPAEMS